MARSKSPRHRNRSGSPTGLTNPLSSSFAKQQQQQGGELHVSVVGLNDTPLREQPSYMTLKVHRNGKAYSTGPPTSRHKDRNSFKFASPLSQNLVIPSKSLATLYVGTLYVEVVYENQSSQHQNLTGSFPIKELCVNDERKVVLSLSGKDHAVVDYLDEAPPPPTLKLSLELKGSLRPEMATLQQLFQTWFQFMDQVEAKCQSLLIKPASKINKTYLLVPAVPLATATLVIAPIVVGLCVVLFPIFIPFLCAILTVAMCAVATGLVLVASTSTGRTWLQERMVPFQNMMRTESVQALVYPTGPRPNPVSLTRLMVPAKDDMWGRLLLSLVVDAIGSASYLVPVVGEITDVAWAPLQTIIIMALYDTTTPNLKYVSFVEEILPFTDFVPSATIGWAAQFGPKLLHNVTSDKEKNPALVPTDLVLQETGVSAKQK